MIITKRIEHHRNGITGNSFHVGIVKKVVDGKERKMLIIQFDNIDNTAVFDFDLLKKGNFKFGSNSWRGDHFNDEFLELIKNQEKSVE